MTNYTTRLCSHTGLSASSANLTFIRLPLSTAKQARLRGRFALRPEISLPQYRFEAVIDYVKIAFASSSPSQIRHVQTAINSVMTSTSGRVPWIDIVDGTVVSAFGFEVTIQDPILGELANCEKMLRTRFGMTEPARVIAMEISVDAYPRSGVLQRCYMPKFDFLDNIQARPRFATGKEPPMQHLYKWHDAHLATKAITNGDPDAWLKPESAHSPYIDTTFYIEAKMGAELTRIQNKVTNRRVDEVADALPQGEQRARVEVRLSGVALSEVGVGSVSDLLAFDFASLQKKYFHFVLTSFANDHECDREGVIQEWMNQQNIAHFVKTGAAGMILVDRARKASRDRLPLDGIGESLNATLRASLKAKGKTAARPRAGTGIHGSTIAYTELNDKVREALRNLSARSATQMKRNMPVAQLS